jgi:hypothetical protein
MAPDPSLSLSLDHYRGQSSSIHSNNKKTSSKTHSKKNPKSKPIKLNQQEHDKTKKKKRDPQKKKLKPTCCNIGQRSRGTIFIFIFLIEDRNLY